MKDSLINSLQERFAGHEMNVPPDAWNAITAKMAAVNGTALSQTLQEKFSVHEVHVDPHVWEGISSQLGHGVAAGTAATTGWWAAGIAATIVAGGLYIWTATDAPTTEAQPIAEIPAVTVPAPAPQDQSALVVVPSAQAQEKEKAAVPTSSTPSARTSTQTDNKATGSEVVQGILQQLVEENTADPHPAEVEIVPPPTPAELSKIQEPLPAPAGQGGAGNPGVQGSTDPAAPAGKTEDPAKSDEGGAATAGDPGDESAQGDQEVKSALEPTIFIPNVFSPQGDGTNDHLEITGINYQKVDVRIFSARSNALVFAADNLDVQWNGRDLKGVPCEEGYYFYAIEATGLDGRVYSKGEVVRLFR